MAITINGLVCNQNDQEFYCCVLDRNILKTVSFVARRDEDAEKGFQRVLNLSRAKAIAKYMDIEKGVIPSALILSAQDNANLTFDKRLNKITFSENPNSFLVLDGQHRLYGLINSEENYHIPVIIFNKLKTSEEVNLFIDINTTQKGVPTTLLLDIKNLTGKEGKKEEKQRELFDLINKNSILSGVMSPTKSSPGKISRNTFNQATNDIFEVGYFANESVTTLYKGVKNYLEAAENILQMTGSSNAKITKSMIFRSIFNLFPDIVESCLKKYGDLKVESIEKELEPIALLNFDNYTGSSEALLKKITLDMKMEINRQSNKEYNFNNDIF